MILWDKVSKLVLKTNHLAKLMHKHTLNKNYKAIVLPHIEVVADYIITFYLLIVDV